MSKENRKYKDSVFTDLFYSDRDALKNLLSLYNALYETDYKDPGIIEKSRLEGVAFRNFINDIAFKVDNRRIILGEHQSTINYNMPLRNLMYFGREMEMLIQPDDRYRKKMVRIPTPEFITFYNGEEDSPLEQALLLSDAFIEPDDPPSIELKTRVININYGKKHPLLEKCAVLKDYSHFVEIARTGKRNGQDLEDAIVECINQGILKDYLKRKGTEVINMLMVEYDYEADIRIQREEAEQEGREEGRKEGRKEGREEGRKEGRKEGQYNEKKATVLRLHNGGASMTVIQMATGLDKSDIEKILKQ